MRTERAPRRMSDFSVYLRLPWQACPFAVCSGEDAVTGCRPPLPATDGNRRALGIPVAVFLWVATSATLALGNDVPDLEHRRLQAAFASSRQTPSDPDGRPQESPGTAGAGAGMVFAARMTTAVDIDGRLEDRAWLAIVPTAGFVQRDPNEGVAATETTEVRVAYDSSALYVGVRMLDREPEKIVRRFSRRDRDADGDAIAVYLDPRNDGLTGVLLEVSAAGVQRDAIIFNDFETDEAWDAVWDSAVSIDELGWAVEIRIPFSQLRFPPGEAPTWGINVERFIHRKNESAWLQLVRKDERRLASRMAQLAGLQNLQSRAHLEVLPYVAARSELIVPDAGDPFNDGSRNFGVSGVDVKWAVSSQLTIDATFNPDFGQVEVDPSEINLTEFETSFEEKRPFFVEGAQIFSNFARSGTGSSLLDAELFYSRRIGREPQGSASGDFVDMPTATTILGAAKVTGKTASGWSLGLLNALTSTEHARVRDGHDLKTEVEPLTNYVVGRLFHEGTRSGSGFMTTAVNRRLAGNSTLGARLPGQSYAGGYDGYVFLDSSRRWVVSGVAAASHVTGTTAAIRRLQVSSRRYFQRPDADYVTLSEDATSLSGWTSGVSLRRQSGSLRMSASAVATSPGFEVNDLGFQSRADQIEAEMDVTWTKYSTDWLSRRRSVSLEKSTRWNFGRSKQSDSWSVETALTFRNYWYAEAQYRLDLETDDDHLTRGGPVARSPRAYSAYAYFGTDDRRRVWIGGGGDHQRDAAGGWETSTYANVFFRPSERIRVSTGPSYYRSSDVAQFVDTVEDPLKDSTFGTRYVFAGLQQTYFSMTTRADLSFSPTVSLQLYGEPFFGVGRYADFKELSAAKTFAFIDYGRDGGSVSYDPDEGAYSIDPDGEGPAARFTLFNEDFNVKKLVAKAVFRWEWRPGSTLYVAWSQERSDDRYAGDFNLGRDTRALFRAPADDVFLVKLSYWFSR